MTRIKYYVVGARADGSKVIRWYKMTENKADPTPVFDGEEEWTKLKEVAIASNPAYRRLSDG